MKRTTIKDVAKRAGVSITTVSHALSGGGVVKQETRERIRDLAREMNYMPNWSGKSLKTVETKIIGLYVEYIRGFYGQLADAMCDQCRAAGYELNVVIGGDGETILDNLLSHRVDGAIILHDGFSEQDAQTLLSSELPTVFLDRELIGAKASCVLFDSYQTGFDAAQYLYALGHRDILLVEGKNTYDGIERSRGFAACMASHGKRVRPQWRISGDFDRNAAYAATEDFLRAGNRPSAVFAANDDSAIGCIQALRDAGLRVPQDVSVMGCDNIELSRWYVPALTTMDTNITEQGTMAIRELLELVQTEKQGSAAKISATLIARDSCRKCLED